MKLHPNEMWIYYHDNSASQKKTRALATSITKHVHEINIGVEKITLLRWREILDMLNLTAKKLLNRADPVYQQLIARHDFDEHDWLEIIAKNPSLLKAPIAIMNDGAILCEAPQDIYKLPVNETTDF